MLKDFIFFHLEHGLNSVYWIDGGMYRVWFGFLRLHGKFLTKTTSGGFFFSILFNNTIANSTHIWRTPLWSRPSSRRAHAELASSPTQPWVPIPSSFTPSLTCSLVSPMLASITDPESVAWSIFILSGLC